MVKLTLNGVSTIAEGKHRSVDLSYDTPAESNPQSLHCKNLQKGTVTITMAPDFEENKLELTIGVDEFMDSLHRFRHEIEEEHRQSIERFRKRAEKAEMEVVSLTDDSSRIAPNSGAEELDLTMGVDEVIDSIHNFRQNVDRKRRQQLETFQNRMERAEGKVTSLTDESNRSGD